MGGGETGRRGDGTYEVPLCICVRMYGCVCFEGVGGSYISVGGEA